VAVAASPDHADGHAAVARRRGGLGQLDVAQPLQPDVELDTGRQLRAGTGHRPPAGMAQGGWPALPWHAVAFGEGTERREIDHALTLLSPPCGEGCLAFG
jgi:hypothetical protein